MFASGAALTFGVGLYDLARGHNLRFARALVGTGVLWSLSALEASPEPTLYSIGRVSQWLVELAFVYLLLSYPSGRLVGRAQRGLFASGVLLVAVFYFPTALIMQQYPAPSPWSLCAAGCAHNVFALGHSTPGVVTDFVLPARELLTVALLVGVSGVAIQRSRTSGAVLGRLSAPIALIAVVQTVMLAVYLRLRSTSATAPGLDALSWIYVMSLPAVAFAVVIGRLYRRLFAAKALDRIARGLKTNPSPADASRVMACALEDPSLRIFHSFPLQAGDWVDESGVRLPAPQSGTERVVTEVANGNWRIAIEHDRALAGDPALIRTAGSYALAALENEELGVELRSSLKELDEARALGITAEQRERRKIERDIHDGAQQHLVALRVKLAVTAERLGEQDVAAGDALQALAHDIDATIDEVRSFARGIYPPHLAETGLAGALATLGRDTGIPLTINADGLGRYPREIETTIYFSCSEALQNAAKHAAGATSVTVKVWDAGELIFEVRDDGPGFDVPSTPFGTGLTSLNDRLTAVGGQLRLWSAPGRGTTVGGTIPTVRVGSHPRRS